jgi:precorrin-6A/cobalt-precorrin-6A reductase
MDRHEKFQATQGDVPARVLILGGTGEAREIAARLAVRTDLVIISSLAGRVSHPRPPEGIVRIGGFGGVDGLTSYLVHENIAVVIDATHPFAVAVSRNAEAACQALNLPLIAFARQPWVKIEGDRWHEVADLVSAASFIANKKDRIFLTIGRQALDAFKDNKDTWFLIRSIDEPEEALPSGSTLILDRGPFDLEHEVQLMRAHAIDYVVSKNSGGSATYSKIEAARQLGIPVVMIRPPSKHQRNICKHIDEVTTSLNCLLLHGITQDNSR